MLLALCKAVLAAALQLRATAMYPCRHAGSTRCPARAEGPPDGLPVERTSGAPQASHGAR